MAAICRTVEPCGIGGGLTDFKFDRMVSTLGLGLAFTGAGTFVRLGTNDFGDFGDSKAGFGGIGWFGGPKEIPVRNRRRRSRTGGLFRRFAARLPWFVADALRLQGQAAGVGTQRFVLVASQKISQRKNHAKDHDEQNEYAEELPPSEHPIAAAPFAFACRHQRPGSSDFFTQALMMSMGRGKIIVVFFSAPISVSVCR